MADGNPGAGGAPVASRRAADLDVELAVLGGPDGGPSLDLDHERFAYAGKFVASATGKAVAREVDATDDPGDPGGPGDGDVVAAASFDFDRTDPSVVRIRYVTVRRDRRGEGLGARLLDFLAEYALGGAGSISGPTLADVSAVVIAVNNPFAYEAAYRAGFGYTGERTGLAELVLARPGDRSTAAYRRGLSAFRERDDLDEAARAFLDEREEAAPPRPLGSATDPS